MYIIIFEDNQISRAASLDISLFEACDDGILDIVDISNPEAPTTYYSGQWHELPDANTGL